ncbi:class I SAM-dependent methyltransferase [Jannaschia sp. R86511]|uniref:class I SAM-dependent methyltransferase n=1 Tax=Jannaschia sp. R86511 TaxID=3093853 RepID=UPI0036D29ED3
MSGEGSHYFDAQPATDGTRRRRTVELQGRTMEVRTAAGVFSGDRLDLGTQVLLRHTAPVPEQGDLLDLGCGWGPLTLALAAAAPRARVWAVDVNERARELTAANARDNGLDGVRVLAPDDVDPELAFDRIWSNPPIRIGKDALHALLLRWLPRLTPGGRAELVVQRNLGADSLHRWLEESLPELPVHRSASSKGYRVLVLERPLSP